MKVKFYLDINEKMWDYNLDCAEGREGNCLMASSKPSAYKADEYDTIAFVVDLPDKYFKPRMADIVLEESKAMIVSESKNGK